MVRTLIFGRISGYGRTSYVRFFCIHIIYPIPENALPRIFWWDLRISCLSLLDFIVIWPIRRWRRWLLFCPYLRDALVERGEWIFNPSQGFSFKSMLSLLLDPGPPEESVFDVVWRTKVPKKVRSLSVKSCLIPLIEEELRLLGLSIACCVGRRRMILFIFLG